MAICRQAWSQVLPGRLSRPRQCRALERFPRRSRPKNGWTLTSQRSAAGQKACDGSLFDLDAKEANGSTSGQTVGEVIQLYFAFNAPDTQDGLAGSTFRTYRHVASRHLLGLRGMTAGKPTPVARYATEFAKSRPSLSTSRQAPRALREAMKEAKVGPSARAHTWRVLSAVLSWAASSQIVPEIGN